MRSPAYVLPFLLCTSGVAWASPHGCHHRESAQHHATHGSHGSAGVPFLGTSPVLTSFAEAQAQPCHLAFVDIPSGWVASDSHTHYEECNPGVSSNRFFYDEEALANIWMSARDITVATPLLWAVQVQNEGPWDPLNVWTYDGHLVDYGPFRKVFENQWSGVDPTEPPHQDLLSGSAACFDVAFPSWTTTEPPWVTAQRPRVLQAGVEVSGWDASGLGHFTAINLPAANGDLLFQGLGCTPQFDGSDGLIPFKLNPAAQSFDFQAAAEHALCGCPGDPDPDLGYKNDGTGDYSVPLIRDAFKAGGSEAVTGYAHHRWPSELVVEDTTGNVGWAWDVHLADLVSSPDPALRLETHCFPESMGEMPPVRAAFPDNFEGGNTANPLLAAVDVAMNWIDYIEAVELGETFAAAPGTPPPTITCDCAGGTVIQPCGHEDHHSQPEQTSFGLYYKLLSAGQRVGISAGTDQDCGVACAPQTYAFVGDAIDELDKGSQTLTDDVNALYGDYAEALASGRTSLSRERYQFLDMRVNGERIGSELHAPSATSVNVRVHFEVPASFVDDFFGLPDFDDDDRTLELVASGDCCLAPGADCPYRSHEVVWSHTLSAADFTNGVYTNSGAPISVPISKSSWIALRTRSGSAHTAATYVIVRGLPIANSMDAEYWMIYSEYVRYKIRTYLECGATYGADEIFERYLGCSAAEIDQHLIDGREIFESFRDLGLGLPLGVMRYGASGTSECEGPIAIAVGGELTAGPETRLRVACVNAPPGAVGWLFLATSLTTSIAATPIPLPAPFNGSVRYFAPDLSLSQVVTANHGGHAFLEVPLPGGLPQGLELYAQYVWLQQPGCGPEDAWTQAVSIQTH